ncbi:MAG: hypothetical protein IT372_03215 [Polyangiaceae bacterium]|nr:hypothetical protein [Polyangiaceae bacterium]
MKTSRTLRVNAALLIGLGLAGCSDADLVTDSSESASNDAASVQSGAATSGAGLAVKPPDLRSLPVYVVTGRGIDAARAAKLAAALGVDAGAAERILDEDGAIRYIDVERFQQVPARKVGGAAPAGADEQGQPIAANDKAVDLEALEALHVLSEEEALARVGEALADADIDVEGVTTTGHSVFEAYDKDGAQTLEVDLDTQVTYEGRLEGLRLIGPGAKVKVVLDAKGRATQIVLATHELERGEDVAIIPPSQAAALCAEELGGGELRRVTADLVYYAPALSRQAGKIFPQYACGGARLVDGKEVDLRKVMIPAVVDAPRATVTMKTFGGEVRASAEVAGGTAPYTYSWVSSTRSLAQSLDAAEAEYAVFSRTGGAVPETLTLYVTDANGLTAKAAETVLVTPQAMSATGDQQGLVGGSPWGSVGTEWIGTCGGLGGSAGNAGGFVNQFQSSGISAQFNWGEQSAWEIDFKDPTYGGQDTSYADAVDLVFYTGHAAGDGFQFCSSVNDTWLDLGTEAKLGDNNLEWLVIAACGPLQGTQWPSSFAGLHLLLGYTTISWDNTTEGNDFANGLLRYDHLTVRDSWAMAATNAQPPEVIYAYAGVWYWNGSYWTLPNLDDYFWGMGPVGGDYPNTYGTWKITSPS